MAHTRILAELHELVVFLIIDTDNFFYKGPIIKFVTVFFLLFWHHCGKSGASDTFINASAVCDVNLKKKAALLMIRRQFVRNKLHAQTRLKERRTIW